MSSRAYVRRWANGTSKERNLVNGVCDFSLRFLLSMKTIQAIKEVWSEKISPVLVINKIDKLITDLKMDPLDAYKHICQILEQVNASIATFHNEMTSGVSYSLYIRSTY